MARTTAWRIALAALAVGAALPLSIALAHAQDVSGVAIEASQPAVSVETLTPGEGDPVPAHSWVLIDYKGSLVDGTVFDQAERMPLALDNVVPGFAQGLVQMRRGGTYRLSIPPELGYGAQASGPIPANSTLVFEITLHDFKTPAEIAVIEAEAQKRELENAKALIEAAKAGEKSDASKASSDSQP